MEAVTPTRSTARGLALAASLALGGGCASTTADSARAGQVSASVDGRTASLVGRWGEACRFEILSVGESGDVLARDTEGNVVRGTFSRTSPFPQAAGTLVLPWPVAVTPQQVITLTATAVVGDALVYTYAGSGDVLWLTGPHPHARNGGQPIHLRYHLDRCEGAPRTPRDWTPRG